jgi:hypothetical protein
MEVLSPRREAISNLAYSKRLGLDDLTSQEHLKQFQ